MCRLLRLASDAILVVVTARGAESERVRALDLGADDYLVKPFGFAELLARLRAALRRTHPEDAPANREQLQAGPLTVDLRAHRVSVDGREVSLTAKEFDLLAVLAEDPGRVLSRQEILERVWDTHWYGPTKVLDVHVAAVRRKLGAPGLIETIYGVGFRLAEPEPPSESPT
ncbi:MAG: response regulator transcription factor [Mycobacteriales bacterium]